MELFFKNKFFIIFIFFIILVFFLNLFYIDNLLETISTMKSIFYVDFFIFDYECRFFDFEI